MNPSTIAAAEEMPVKSVCMEANEIINGPRRQSYGGVKESFERIATMWSEVIGSPVTANQVGLCMILLKVSRQRVRHQRDNLVDIAGYADLINQLHDS